MAKRRQSTPEFKANVVLEVLSGLKAIAEVCWEHKLQPQIINRWRS